MLEVPALILTGREEVRIAYDLAIMEVEDHGGPSGRDHRSCCSVCSGFW
jgi:hypothetical protein